MATNTGLNTKSLDHIKKYEGFVPNPAPDPAGILTVGYGHKCQTRTCSEAGPFPLTEGTATSLLHNDVQRAKACITSQINDKVPLNDNQVGALTSWAYNVGCGATRTSSLVQRLNKGEDPKKVISEELPRWNKSTIGGEKKVLSGLVNRRDAEVELFNSGLEIPVSGDLPCCQGRLCPGEYFGTRCLYSPKGGSSWGAFGTGGSFSEERGISPGMRGHVKLDRRR